MRWHHRHHASDPLPTLDIAEEEPAEERIAPPSVSSPKLERRLQTPEELYYDECWADLPEDIQEAYAKLGHSEDLWDNGGTSGTDDFDWEELGDAQQEAALFIG